MFPVLAADGSRHAISIRGRNIVATRATDNFLSLTRQKVSALLSFSRLRQSLEASDVELIFTM
jgi:hypothetical protein